MISICTVVADTFGKLILDDKNESTLPSIVRSSYVAQTIGGSVVVQDHGLSIGTDRISFEIDYTANNEFAASRIGKNHSQVTLSYRSGFYKASVNRVEINKENIKIELTPIELLI